MNRFSSLDLAVVGHTEWVNFLQVDRLPAPGLVVRALRSMEEPAGGGSVCAVQMARLTRGRVQFFTALGSDELGQRSLERLQNLGLEMHIAWRDSPTRRGISMVDSNCERAITVIGDRLQPQGDDPLPWERLTNCDGVFVLPQIFSSEKSTSSKFL